MAHPLSGADPGTLWRAFGQGGRPDRWARAATIWMSVLLRAPISGVEHALVTPRLPTLEDIAPPVFIIGHWRSGTTHLYNTMAQSGWGTVPPLAVGLPWDMFGIARAARPLLERALPEHRWIDRMPVTPQSPQEDEIAIASMSPLSFYHGIYFPRQFDRLIDRGLFFDDVPPGDTEAWAARFRLFVRRLSHQQRHPLLIKNPVYTGRVAMLRRIFPGARFIHLHRNPFDVFLSMRNFYARLLEVMALQDVPADLDIDATILRVYRRLMTAFDAETAGLGPHELVEFPYSSLDADPMGVLAGIYSGLGLEGYDTAVPAFRRYLDSVARYQKNTFKGDREAVAKVSAGLAPWIERWGYQVPRPADAA